MSKDKQKTNDNIFEDEELEETVVVEKKKEKKDVAEIPAWAKAEGVEATKAEAEAFKPKPTPSRVNREVEGNTDWMKL